MPEADALCLHNIRVQLSQISIASTKTVEITTCFIYFTCPKEGLISICSSKDLFLYKTIMFECLVKHIGLHAFTNKIIVIFLNII